MLSNSCQYALRALIFITEKGSENEKLRASDIATALEIPAPFLSKILKELSSENHVSSTKGPGGGFYLTESQMENKIIDIVTCSNGLDKFNSCFMGLPACSDANPCSVHDKVVSFRKEFMDYLSTHSITDLALESAQGISHII